MLFREARCTDKAFGYRKKREAYHGSESALCILNEHAIQVVRKVYHFSTSLFTFRCIPSPASRILKPRTDPLYQISTFKQTSEEQSRPCVKGVAGALLRLQPPPGARIRHVGAYECSGTWALDWELKVRVLFRSAYMASQKLLRVPNLVKEKNATMEWQGEMPSRGRWLAEDG